jgi:cytoskeletal protein RodZ
MLKRVLLAGGLCALLAACGERAMENQKEMSKEAIVDPSAATTAVPQEVPLQKGPEAAKAATSADSAAAADALAPATTAEPTP